jgi:hypothetical protein
MSLALQETSFPSFSSIARCPPSQLVISFILVQMVAYGGLWALMDPGGLRQPMMIAAGMPFVVLLAMATYWLCVRVFEQRQVSELSLSGALSEFGWGVLLGTSLLGATMAAIWLSGGYVVETTNPWFVVLPPLSFAIFAAFVEETLFRGILFRIVEKSLGTWVALTVSATLFGLVHFNNPGGTWLSSLAIGLEAGVLLGAAYVLTRRLWFAIGIHAAWNFVQEGLLGIQVPERRLVGLWQGQIDGPAWLVGGSYGIEESLVAITLCLTAGVCLLFIAHRRGQFIAPFWVRRRAARAG